MTDEELRKVYDDACETAGGYIHPRPAALRAVFLAGAKAQREMRSTFGMIAAASQLEAGNG